MTTATAEISISVRQRRGWKIAFWLVAAPAVITHSKWLMRFAIFCMYDFKGK